MHNHDLTMFKQNKEFYLEQIKNKTILFKLAKAKYFFIKCALCDCEEKYDLSGKLVSDNGKDYPRIILSNKGMDEFNSKNKATYENKEIFF